MQHQDNSEQLLQLAVHAAPSGILIVNRDGKIVFANRALLDMFGYVIDELIGEAIEILVPSARADAHRQRREAFAMNPSPRVMGRQEHFDAVRKNGDVFPVEIGLQPSEVADEKMVVATVIDTTQRKLIEDRLHRHEEHLEELVEERTHALHAAQVEKERVTERLIQTEKLAAIGTLVSGIGHEINNPLYFILGTAEALENETDSTVLQRYGKEIVEHCRRIAATVRNLSQYARPGESHGMELVDLNDVVAAALQTVKRSPGADTVDIDWTANPVVAIRGKAEELQQVLFNIIRNAIQACGAIGVVRIETREDDEQVTVSISDSGPGIPEHFRKQVFDPFFTTKGPDDGEGLGLYIVQQIVLKHGGDIDLDSDGYSGTTFTVRFPVAEKNEG